MIWILTDTAQELKHDPENGLYVVNLPVVLNGEVREKPLEKEEFYSLLENDDMTITTSMASPAVLEEVFEKLTANGDDVVAILLSSTLSGTYNSARLASQDNPHVFLVDSRNACLGQSALVERAMEIRDKGLSAREMQNALELETSECVLLAAVPSLKYLKKGGRVPAAVAVAGDLMGIKPLVTINLEGQVVVDSKVRGMKKAVKACAARALELGLDPERPIQVGFSGLDDANARLLKEELEKETGLKIERPLVSLSNVLAVHAGPDAAGLGFFVKKKPLGMSGSKAKFN